MLLKYDGSGWFWSCEADEEGLTVSGNGGGGDKSLALGVDGGVHVACSW